MDKKSATAAADSLAQRYSDRTGGEAQRSRDVAFHLAYELLPDDAVTACVFLGEENEPTLVALGGQQLYLLTIPRPGEVPAATGKLRTIRVAPDTGTAEVDATCRGFGEYPPQEATWRFKLDGVSIELQIKRDAEGRTTSDWPLAKALAEALGWKISQGE